MTTDHANLASHAQAHALPSDGRADGRVDGRVDGRADGEADGGADDRVVVGVFETAYSIKELAEQLHVSCQTLYDLRSQGRGPTGFRVGRQLRFRRSEVEAWLLRMEAEDLDRHAEAGRS